MKPKSPKAKPKFKPKPSPFQPTISEQAVIFERYQDGDSAPAICIDFEHCTPRHVYDIVKKMNGKIRRTGPPAVLSEKDIEYAINEYQRGISMRSIARKLKVSYPTIALMLAKRGVKRPNNLPSENVLKYATIRDTAGNLPYNEKGEFIP